jgi:3'(2'), 5'-bisphosphate nucleotidase
MTNPSRELRTAIEAARLSETRIMEFYNSMDQIADAQANITTQADRDSQDIILGHLHQAFPSDGFLGEENTPLYATLPRQGNRLWVVDPIDGTRGFAKKNGEFCIMIAMVQNHEVQLGVVLDPTRKRLTYAEAGAGCWRRDGLMPDIRCSVSPNGNTARLTLTRSRPKTPGKLEGKALLLAPEKLLETYSAGLKFAAVARGEADAYTNDYPSYNDWDICAGHILVEEAGGKVSSLAGRPLLYGAPVFEPDGFLASNGVLHNALLAKIRPSA